MNKQTRTSNSIQNIIVAVGCQILGALLGFATKTIFIKLLGDTYNGMLGFFANIVSVLSLAELGLGTAITFALYKPIAEDDIERLQALMRFYKKVYTYIAGIVFVLGVAILPLLPLLMKEVKSDKLIYLYYFIYLSNTVASYLFIYKSALLNADQRNRIVRLIHMLYTILRNLIEIGVLLLTHNFIAYLFVQLCCTLLNNFTISIIADKLYPWLKKKAENLPKEETKKIFSDVKSVVFYKVGGVLLNNTDNILITLIVGVIAVGYYSNYMMLVSLVMTVLELMFSALSGSVGNLNAGADKERSKTVYNMIGFIGFWIYAFCAISLFVLLDDIVLLWLGKERVLGSIVSLALALNLFVYGLLQGTMVFRNTTSLFRKTKFIILITAGLNIVLSIGMGYAWGIAGIVFATSISRLLTNFWYEPHILHKDIFECSSKGYFIKVAKYVIIAIVAGSATYFLAGLIAYSGIWSIIYKLFICLSVPNLIFLLFFCRSTEFQYVWKRALDFLKKGKGKQEKKVVE